MDPLSLYFTVSPISHLDQYATRQNVRKSVYYINYKGVIEDEDVPLAYVGSKEISPASNLSIVHNEDSVTENSLRAFSGEVRWEGASNYVGTKYFLLTDVWGDFVAKDPVPFYWKHVLPSASIPPDSVAILNEDLTEVPKYSYQTIRRNVYDETTGLAVDDSYEDCSVFSNYLNSYDPQTGDAVVYFVRYQVANQTHYQILNPKPAFDEATWEDVWSVTTTLKPWRKVYILSPGTSHFALTTPRNDVTYSLLPLQQGRIIVHDPLDSSDEEPWFARISNGSFSRIAGGQSFSYSVPEYSSQSFNPLKPYKLKVNEQAVQIRGDLLKVDATPMKVASSFYVMEILVKNRGGSTLYALTTDSSRDGDYYYEGGERKYREIETDNAWITWDTSGIVGWDEEGGFVHLLENYPDTYRFYVTYHYEERYYELTTLNLNPVFDESYNGQFYALYVVPVGGNNNNTGTQESSIHYVKVNRSGRVIETSQDDPSGNYDLESVIQTGGEYIHYSMEASTTTSRINYIGQNYVALMDVGDFPDSGVVVIGDEDVTGSSIVLRGFTSRDTTQNRLYLSSVLTSQIAKGVAVKLYSFEHLLSSNFSNGLQWLILAQVHIAASMRPDELSIIDLRRVGGVIKEAKYEDAIAIDPRAIWARPEVIDSRGQPTPGNSIAVIKVPFTVLEDYGGDFSPLEIDAIVKKHIATGVMPVVLYHGAVPEISSATQTSTTITVCWYSEGTEYSYNIYRAYTKNGPWTLVNSSPILDQVYGNCYTLTGLQPSRIYYIAITSIDSNSVESPKSVAWGVKTRSS